MKCIRKLFHKLFAKQILAKKKRELIAHATEVYDIIDRMLISEGLNPLSPSSRRDNDSLFD